MVKSVNPLLNADVRYAMGHGDRLVVCDTNFRADTIAGRFLFSKGVIRPDGE
jgi:L-fucose mutarotase